MARRIVYGNSWSGNGWPMVDQGSCQWVKVPGTNVSLQIQVGQPLAILRAFAADFNAFVEPLRDADSACWTPTNSVASSNHLSGTAMDLNWNSHPFQVANAGFDAVKIAAVRNLLDFYEGTVFWGNDWSSPKDAMHFQLASLANGGSVNTYNNPKVNDFIARKIRADGFSTYGRWNIPNTSDAAVVLSDATGLPLARASEILPTMSSGLVAANCVNPNRIAMAIAQWGHESDNFKATEEYASGAAYEGRIDLGNTQPGDGIRFKGRSWIQITGRHNYGEFSKWAYSKGFVPTPTYFVKHPAELADLKWAGIGAAWYWTVARPTINSFCDTREIYAVTRLINGGLNGIDDRVARYNRAQAVGPRLLSLLNTDEQDEWDALMADDTLYPSASPYRTDDKPVLTLRETLRQTNGMVHAKLIEDAALQGHPGAIAAVAQLAQGQGPGASDLWKVEQAKSIIRTIQANIAAQTGAVK